MAPNLSFFLHITKHASKQHHHHPRKEKKKEEKKKEKEKEGETSTHPLHIPATSITHLPGNQCTDQRRGGAEGGGIYPVSPSLVPVSDVGVGAEVDMGDGPGEPMLSSVSIVAGTSMLIAFVTTFGCAAPLDSELELELELEVETGVDADDAERRRIGEGKRDGGEIVVKVAVVVEAVAPADSEVAVAEGFCDLMGPPNKLLLIPRRTWIFFLSLSSPVDEDDDGLVGLVLRDPLSNTSAPGEPCACGSGFLTLTSLPRNSSSSSSSSYSDLLLFSLPRRLVGDTMMPGPGVVGLLRGLTGEEAGEPLALDGLLLAPLDEVEAVFDFEGVLKAGAGTGARRFDLSIDPKASSSSSSSSAMLNIDGGSMGESDDDDDGDEVFLYMEEILGWVRVGDGAREEGGPLVEPDFEDDELLYSSSSSS